MSSSVADRESRLPVGSSAKIRFGRVIRARAVAYADRVIFLADGRVVRELAAPTADRILDVIREQGAR